MLAFPNAYVSTDEPPRRSRVRTALCVAAMVGVGYLGLVILGLSLFSTRYSPITQVASDYGVGTYALAMNSGFFLAGVGVISLGWAAFSSADRRSQRIGSVLLFPAGLALVVNAFNPTDIEGAVRTLHGTIHGFGGAVFFFTAPAALLLVTYGLGRRGFFVSLLAFAVAVVLLALDTPLSLNAAGLAERVAILVIFTSAILTSVRILRRT
ncbi:MAG: DUF998 domain-containing protein [Thaumarchaeota archaeon]|nr:DUF998 domain-containing protein [Nitrososphaerota archaeon]